MGLQKQQCFSAQCDKCKDLYTNSNGFSIFIDHISLLEELDQDEWANQNGQLLCFTCLDYTKHSQVLSKLKIQQASTD